VSDTPADLLVPRLRDLGIAPVVEGPDGVVHLSRREAHRARTPRVAGPAQEAESAARRTARSAATVTAIRAGDRAGAVRPTAASPAARQSPAAALAMLREAAEEGTTVWIGYVDNDGSTHERVVDPERVEGGRLRAFDHRSEEVRSFAVHRINSVRPLSTVDPIG
jgi:predicted DNA-binding transcriptional regulator YafY